MNKERLITLSMIVLAAAASRLLPHPDNVAPIAAIALFAGAQFERKSLAFVIPLSAMLLSDIALGFYEGMWMTYVGFAAVVCVGFTLRGFQKALPVAGATLLGSALFFLITNFAPLALPSIYPATFEGVMQSYVAALPFFRNTLIGDAFYSALLFGGFALAEYRFSWLRLRSLQAA